MISLTTAKIPIKKIFLILLLVLITIFFLLAQGTDDVIFWKNWASNAETYGLISGFRANNDMYPPLATVILYFSLMVSKVLNFDLGGTVRVALVTFFLLNSILFWLWTRNELITIVLHFSLLLGSVAFKSIDIFFAPFLLISLWSLKEKKYLMFSVFFTLASLIKWQPIIIAPFVALYITEVRNLSQFRDINFKLIIPKILLPVFGLLTTIFLIFGFSEVYTAFSMGLSNIYLSGNALNFNWIITHFSHVLNPDVYGGLIDGQATYIVNPSSQSILFSKIIFYFFYFVTIALFLKVEKKFENMILFSLVGYFAYFTFNTGVHESHLFLATMLSVILFWLNKHHIYTMIIMILMYNLNLIVFFGIDGRGLTFSRVINGRIDIALILAVFNVCFFVYFWITTVFSGKNKAASIEDIRETISD